MHTKSKIPTLCMLLPPLMALTACGSSNQGAAAPSNSSYAIGGSLSGLGTGLSVVLQNNGGDNLTVTANGTFTFVTKVSGSYAVTVLTQPTNQNCSVTGGSGTASSNVTGIAVACSATTVSVPNVVGGTQAAATAAITGAGLTVGTVTMQSSATVASGNVISENPPSGSSVTAGSAVALVMSSGAAAAASAKVIYSFAGGGDGSSPIGRLAEGSDGNLYGLTQGGGQQNVGTAFGVSFSGAKTIIYNFSRTPNSTGNTDGDTPTGSLLFGNNGYLYGTTNAGGYLPCNGSGCGVMFRLSLTGSEYISFWTFSATSQADGAFGELGTLVQTTSGELYGVTSGGGTYICGQSGGGCGAIISANDGYRSGSTGGESLLYSFQTNGTTDGAYPYGLIQGSDGNFYGTTSGGGQHGFGTVFRVTASGSEAVLYSIADSAGVRGIVQGTDGNFYFGGTTLYRMTSSGTVTALYSFNYDATSCAVTRTRCDGDASSGPLIQAKDGNFYGTTSGGGTQASGTVFRLTPSGVETVIYSFKGGTDGANPRDGLMQASDGNLYVVTSTGGASNFGAVVQIIPGP